MQVKKVSSLVFTLNATGIFCNQESTRAKAPKLPKAFRGRS